MLFQEACFSKEACLCRRCRGCSWVSRVLAGFLCMKKKRMRILFLQAHLSLGDRAQFSATGMPSQQNCEELYVVTPPAPTPTVCPNPLPALVLALGRWNAARSGARCPLPLGASAAALQPTEHRNSERRDRRLALQFHSAQRPHVVLSREGALQVLGLGEPRDPRVSPMLTGAPNKVRRRSAQPASE